MPMRARCCVPECTSCGYTPNCLNLPFHRIPASIVLAQKWLYQIKNPTLSITHFRNARICGKHFKKNQYKDFDKHILKRGVIPVLYLPKVTTKTKKSSKKSDTTNNLVENSFSVIHNSLEKKLFSPSKTVENVNVSFEEPVRMSVENDSSSEPSIESNSSKTYDFNKTCRICLVEKEDLHNIQSEFIQNMFQYCNVLKFSDNDTFPKQICTVCISELKIVYNFSKKCGKSTDILQKYTEKLSTTNAEDMNSSCDELQGFSETVEISYVPTATENVKITQRQYKYSLFSADSIEKPVLASITRKETSLAAETEISTSETENTGCLESNSILKSVLLAKNSAFDSNIPENNCLNNVAEEKTITDVKKTTNSVTSTELTINKRILRKRKLNQNTESPVVLIKEKYNAPMLPTEKTKIAPEKPDTVLVSATIEQDKEMSQNSEILEENVQNSATIVDKSQRIPDSKDDARTSGEKRAKHVSRMSRSRFRTVGRESRMSRSRSRTVGRKSRTSRSRSRTVGRESRTSRSRSRTVGRKSRTSRSRSRTVTRKIRKCRMRKKIASASDDTIYWYDRTSAESNRINSELNTPLLNRNESSIGFSNNSQSIIIDLTLSEDSNNIESIETIGDTGLESTDTVGVTGLESTDTVGNTGLESTDTVGNTGLESTETVGNNLSVEINTHSDTTLTPVLDNITTLDSLQVEKPNTDEDAKENQKNEESQIAEFSENQTEQVKNRSVSKRGRGRPRRSRGIVNLTSDSSITNTAISDIKSGNKANENDNTVAGTTESVPRSTEYESSNKTSDTPITRKSRTKTSNRTTPIAVKSSTEIDNTAASMNVKTSTKTSNTKTPITDKSSTKTSSTTTPIAVKSSTETDNAAASMNVKFSTKTRSATTSMNVKSSTKTNNTATPIAVKSSTETDNTAASINVKSSTKTSNTNTPITDKSSTKTNNTATPIAVKSSTETDNTAASINVKSSTKTSNTTAAITDKSSTKTSSTTTPITVKSSTKTNSTTTPITVKSSTKTNNTATPIAVKSSTETDNTAASINVKSSTKTSNTTTSVTLKSNTAKCNTGNTVKRTTRSTSSPKRFTRTANNATHITKGNNSTLTHYEEKSEINNTILPKINNMNTALQVLPTEENGSVQLNNDCQQNSAKITKQDEETSSVIQNNNYMKLRRRNVKLSLNSPNKIVNVVSNNLNMKHLDISKKELNKLFSVKLELKKFKQSNRVINTINKDTIKNNRTRIFNKPTVENNRQLRSSKRNSFNGHTDCVLSNSCSNVENVKLTKDTAVQQVDIGVVDKDINKTIHNPVNNACEPTKIVESTINNLQKEEVNSNSCEIDKLEQNTCLENNVKQDTCSENSVKQDTCSENNNIQQTACSANNETKVDTCLEATVLDDKICAQNSAIEHNTSVKNTEKDLKTEHVKCSPNTTTEHHVRSPESELDYDTCSPNSKTSYETCSSNCKAEIETCSPNIKAENATCSLNFNTEHNYCSLNSKIERETCSPNNKIDHDTCSLNSKTAHDTCSLNSKTANDTCSPNNKSALQNSTVVKNENEDNVTKNQLIDHLTEFVVFANKNSDSNTLEDNSADVPIEQNSPNKYYQLLDATQMVQDDIHIVHSDAMISNLLPDSPGLTANVPTVYDEMTMNDSFETTINNILNTECNTVCDGQLVGSGIILPDNVINEVVVTSVENENEPISYQHAGETNPSWNINKESVYFNKKGGLIFTSDSYASKDEYSSNRFHNSWVPIVQVKRPTDSSRKMVDTIQSVQEISVTSDTNERIDIAIPTQERETSTLANSVVEQNLRQVGDTAFCTEHKLGYDTTDAEEITCPHCKQTVNIDSYEAHVKQHENGETFCCEHCGCIFYDSDTFINHQSHHNVAGMYKCRLCQLYFDTKNSLTKHLTVHASTQNQCKYCQRKFTRIHALITHLSKGTCLKKEKYKCIICNVSFSGKAKYAKHVVMHSK